MIRQTAPRNKNFSPSSPPFRRPALSLNVYYFAFQSACQKSCSRATTKRKLKNCVASRLHILSNSESELCLIIIVLNVIIQIHWCFWKLSEQNISNPIQQVFSLVAVIWQKVEQQQLECSTWIFLRFQI